MFFKISNDTSSAQLSATFIALMAFIPFILAYHRLPIPSFLNEWVAGLLGVMALFQLLKKEFFQPLEIPQIALVFVGFIFIVVMQLMMGMLQSTQYALLVIAYLTWAFCLTTLGNHLRRQLGWEKITTALAWAIVAGGIVNIVFIGLQYSFKTGLNLPFMPNFDSYGTLGQLNHLASYIALALSSLIYLLFKRRINIAPSVFIGLLFLGLLAFSGSRSTWLYLIAIIILSTLLRLISKKQSSTTSALQVKQSQQLLWLAYMLLPMFALIQALVGWLTDGMVNMPNSRMLTDFGGAQVVGGLSVRLHIWYESLRLFLQSPWIGIGFGQTRWMSFYMLDNQWLVNLPGSYEHAHNLVIHIFAELGIAGGLLLLAGAVAWLRGFQWKNINLESWYVLALLFIIGIHSMLEYPLWYAYFLGLTAFLLGAGDENRQQWNVQSVGQRVGILASSALLIIAFGLLVNTYMANKNLEKWVAKGIQGQINAQNQTDFFRSLGWVASNSLLAPYTNLIYANSLKPSKKNLAEKIVISESAMRFVPTRTSVYRHVLLLELNSQHTEAVQYLRRAIQAFPNDFNPELQKLPLQYWDLYLRLFSEAVAKPTDTNPTAKIGYQQQPI